MELADGLHPLPFIKSVISSLIDKGNIMLEAQDNGSKQLVQLEKLLPAINGILENASADMFKEGPLKDLMDAVYAADDVVDDCDYRDLEIRRKSGDTGESSSKSSLRCFLCFTKPENKSKAKMFGELDAFNECIKKIVDVVEKCTALSSQRNAQYSYYGSSSKEAFKFKIRPDQDTALIGRDAEVRRVIDKIHLSDDPHYRLGVGTLPMVGMLGFGTSTIAQAIFNHEDTKSEFPIRMWVCMSGDFDMRTVLLQMIEMVKDGDELCFSSDSTMDEIENELMDMLKDKRFLLVVDDVIDIGKPQWKKLLKVFKSAASRSLILVTTQSEIVAETVGTMEPLKLSMPSWHDQWLLFKQCAFGGQDLRKQPDGSQELSPLENLGEQIVRKLDGLPLSVKALGRALHGRKEEGHWRHVLESKQWEQDGDGIPPALWLSYQHLRPSLRRCFAYCSVFPSDYIYEKEKVVQIWGSQGLIHTDVGKRVEDIGMDIFLELTDRCFFLQTGDGRYKMHTMMHQLACKASSHESFTITDSSGHVPREVHHLTIKTANLAKIKEDLDVFSSPTENSLLKQLRTLLFFGAYDDTEEATQVMDAIFSKLQSIRVLKIPFRCNTEVLSRTSNLKHMRYFDASGNKMEGLPDSICRLYHLLVLNFQQCPNFRPPRNLGNLMNLRYLYTTSDTIATILQIQSLTSLQELPRFRANSISGMDALRGMTQLRNSLHIEHLELVSEGECKWGILKASKHIKKLTLSWDSKGQNTSRSVTKQISMDEEILEYLQPHENLECLKINGYPGTCSPSWMLQRHSLSKIKCVHLSNHSRLKVLPPLHLLPNLEEMEIKDMQSMEKTTFNNAEDMKEGLFPKLKTLVLRDLPVWTGWIVDGDILFPCLRKLELRNCPVVTILPPIPVSVEELTVENVGLRYIPGIYEDKPSVSSDGSNRQTSSLLSLNISGCPKMKSLSSGLLRQQHLLKSLHSMAIRNCENLESGLANGFKDLEALENLSIYDCPKLLIVEFPKSLLFLEISECFIWRGAWADDYPHLFSILNFKISGCSHDSSEHMHNVEALDWLNSLFNVYSLIVENTSLLTLNMFDKLRKLVFLEIDGCRAFFNNEVEFQNFRRLRFLSIKNCKDLTSFPEEMSTLPLLEELCIEDCPLISSLPDSGFGRKLKRMSINRCPTLSERCKDDNFEKPKISSISCVYIDGECMQL